MNSEKNGGNIDDLLFDSAVQIAVHDGTDNEVFRRLLAELQNQAESSRIAAAKPLRKFAPSDSDAPVQSQNGKKLG
jgi:hypothetical protein